ncbi:NAD-dependent epimerase/dehydratase family protein [Halovenus rubra]|uniref:NAD-dependent epimerase/dehydratase family protein n=2 Tax=Halovenus rubra TaxID=869890 RepID=A0ACC7E508_9EURY|nr:NAD-dependent epimerase/dehydratase family protein [Halovenus rubra]
MDRALIIGGTRFIGRHLVEELLDNGYEVTLLNRGKHANPFEDHSDVNHITGDRQSGAAIAEAAVESEAQAVFDMVAYYPGEVEQATRWLDDIESHAIESYVYISSGDAYGVDEIPKREGETPMEPCSDEQAVDDSPETYGPRKAEGDRRVFEAATHGFPAMSVRPTIVYGSHDYTGRFEYWVDRVRNHDQILVPGDGTNIHHIVAVENVVRALRTVAEAGEAGEVYNVGDRRICTLGETIETIASILDEDVEIVTASERELDTGGIDSTEFPLYNPDPHILSTEKLSALGWEPLSPRRAFENAIEGPVDPERDPGPEREAETAVLEELGL